MKHDTERFKWIRVIVLKANNPEWFRKTKERSLVDGKGKGHISSDGYSIHCTDELLLEFDSKFESIHEEHKFKLIGERDLEFLLDGYNKVPLCCFRNQEDRTSHNSDCVKGIAETIRGKYHVL